VTSLFPPLYGGWITPYYGGCSRLKQQERGGTSMVIMTEREKLRMIAELLNQEQISPVSRDVSTRSRDQKGRFQKESRRQEKSKYESARIIKLKKVRGSYGTYIVKTKILTEGEFDLIIIFGLMIILSVIF
jgi:hypothetical protein